MGKVIVTRYDKTTGLPIAVIENETEKCTSDYALYGGCKNASLDFVATWGSDFVTSKGEELRIKKDGLPVFAGTVISIAPNLASTIQSVEVDGWVNRLDEIEIVTPPVDKIIFGIPGSDYPLITTAFGVVTWLVDNKIIPDSQSSITAALYPTGLIKSATYSCKLGPSGFVIYANDKLTKVLDALATLDDCIYGIDAEAKFYFYPRTYAEESLLFTVPLAQEIPANWKSQPILLPDGGKIISDRRGPSHVAVRSRDINAVPGTRMYRLAGAYEDGTRRVTNIYSPNIRHGQAARRLARGYFRRFNDPGIKVEDLSFKCGSRRLEPHLGRVIVTNLGDTIAEKLAGTISVNWEDVVNGSVTLGENKPDPGSGNPANDPFSSPDDMATDSPQIDTGDSADIDFADGFDGDGDDLHENPLRDDWTDPGAGTDLDYGEDVVDASNGQGSSTGSSIRLAQITGSTHPTYAIKVFKVDGVTEDKNHTDVKLEPDSAPELTLGQFVLVSYLDAVTPIILGFAPARGTFLKITAQQPLNKYDVDILSPSDGVTIIASFTECEAWPPAAMFEVGQEVLGYWFNGADRPRPIGSAGCCSDNYYFVGQVIKD